MSAPVDVLVVGAGIVGSTSAWRLAVAGARVQLVDDGGPAASDVAAGMLAPVTESSVGEQHLTRLGLVALHGFPAFVAELTAGGAPDPGLRPEGTLLVGLTPDDATEVEHVTRARHGFGLTSDRWDARTLRRAEPYLSSAVRSAVHAPGDLSVDNRRLLTAVTRLGAAAGVQRVPGRATELMVAADRAAGVRLADGRSLPAGTVVLAGGAAAHPLTGIPAAAQVPVVPVKGHILRLRPLPGRPGTTVLRHTVRAVAHRRHVYLVPRVDGEIVVGATVEHLGHDRTVAVSAVRELLRSAYEILPVVDDLALAEVSTGLRPGTADNGPAVGWTALTGLFAATGHYRNGILLCRETADEVVRRLDGAGPSAHWLPFAPQRLSPTGAVPAGQHFPDVHRPTHHPEDP